MIHVLTHLFPTRCSPDRDAVKGPAATGEGHPAPHRDRASSRGLLLALAASPAGWIVQLVLDYGLSSFACYPGDTPLRQSPPAGWGGEHLLLAAIRSEEHQSELQSLMRISYGVFCL